MYDYTMKELKYEAYKYILNHPCASPNDIEKDLDIKNGLDVMVALSELREEGYIILKPVPLSLSNSSSVRYIVSGKEYAKEI